jgi:hypothetical protein
VTAAELLGLPELDVRRKDLTDTPYSRAWAEHQATCDHLQARVAGIFDYLATVRKSVEFTIAKAGVPDAVKATLLDEYGEVLKAAEADAMAWARQQIAELKARPQPPKAVSGAYPFMRSN